ncbi:hypothetical protein F0L68_38625 [Solihabitans fulvus]|uniref:Uncharacterized protein n=1 Tax=Solihabitans fulvus TaxID=1892852 RepID=A0A5B2WII6_9PSEU|nr:hypothetical protein [Solihabitans fulvus]KAA2250728.1 hypothetical protein F0L68_38625 [Solihabitans fulvus]
MRAAADRYGFIVIHPSATRIGNCFDASSPQSLTHNGSSDPAGTLSMVDHVEQHNNAWTRTRYADAPGSTHVEAYSIAGVGHSLPLSGTARLRDPLLRPRQQRRRQPGRLSGQ